MNLLLWFALRIWIKRKNREKLKEKKESKRREIFKSEKSEFAGGTFPLKRKHISKKTATTLEVKN